MAVLLPHMLRCQCLLGHVMIPFTCMRYLGLPPQVRKHVQAFVRMHACLYARMRVCACTNVYVRVLSDCKPNL